MSWERRKNKMYFYLARRVNDRVIKTYIGRGAGAEAAAQRDEEKRTERQKAAAELRKAQERVDEATEPLLALCREVDLLVRASLLVAGFHCHKSDWRKRRDRKK